MSGGYRVSVPSLAALVHLTPWQRLGSRPFQPPWSRDRLLEGRPMAKPLRPGGARGECQPHCGPDKLRERDQDRFHAE